MGQLPLRLRWPARQRFAGFVVGENALALSACVRAAGEQDAPWLFLHGARGSGKTHLLLAICAEAAKHGSAAQYLPLADLPRAGDAIRGAAGSAIVAVDNVEALVGDREAEHALFDLYNRCRADGAVMVFAANAPPANLGIELADLVSRLTACTRLQLRPLDETARRNLLRELAAARGIVLDEAVVDFVFRYCPRDPGSLAELVELLDGESLSAKRRITVPFLREVIAKNH